MKNFLIILVSTFILVIGFSDKSNANVLDCEDLYDACIDNNPYDEEDQFFAYYGYINGCSSSRAFCLDRD